MDDRAKTGITELDNMLRGGFMRGDAVLLAGSAGMGKTTLGLEYIINGITKYRENGLYVTFEQLPSQIYRDSANFGWQLKKMEEEDTLRVICTSPNLLLEASDGEHLFDSFIDEVHPKRIVVDSLSHLAMFVPQNELRKEMYKFVMYLKTKHLSSLLLWESPGLMGQVQSITEEGISFLVDAILILKPVEIESSMRKALGILKLRGSDHDKRLTEYEITSEGFKLRKPFVEYEGIMSGSPRKILRVSEADLLKSGLIKRR